MKISKRFGEALEDYHTALRLNPDRTEVLNEIALIRAGAPDPQLRDGNEAVQLATRACNLTDYKNHEYLGTLAAAYAEAGDYETAIKWQNQAVEIAPEDAKKQAQEQLRKYRQREPYRIISSQEGDL